MTFHVLPLGLEFDRVLATHDRSTVVLVRQAGRQLVLRLGDAGAPLPGDPLPFSTVEHPALVAPIDWGWTENGQPFVLRPYAEGVPLDDAVRSMAGSPGGSVPQAAAWSASMLGALAAMHSGGIVHRDIKSTNILVGVDGARLIDFDLSGASGGLVGAVGTRGHIAPEAVLGQPFGPAADLFSLGVTFAFAFLGPAAPEFERRFPAQPFFKAAGLDPDGLPRSIDALVRALVRRHPSDRPASAEAALALLPGEVDAPLPPTGLPAFAGRLQPFEEAIRWLSGERSRVVLSVADTAEVVDAARELRLRLALAGVTVDGPEATVAETLSAGLACLRRALAQDNNRVAVVVPRTVAEALAKELPLELTHAELKELHTVELPSVPQEVIEAHLGRLTLGGSPVVVRRLAASLLERTAARSPEIRRRLQRAVQDGVLRATRDSYVCLMDRWPLARIDAAEDAPERSVEKLEGDAQKVLLSIAVLGDQARPSWLAGVAELPPDRLAEALRVLRAEHILAVERTPDGAFIVPDGAWLHAIRRSVGRGPLAETHGRAARLMGELDPDSFERTLHAIGADPSESTLSQSLERAEAERSAGRVGIARILVRAVLTAASGRTPALCDQAATVLARLEMGQGDAAAAAEALRSARGNDLVGAPHELLQVAGEAVEMAGDRRRARTLFQRILDDRPSAANRGRAILGLAYADWLDGDASGTLERAALIEELPLTADTACILWNVRAGALAQLGRHEESANALQKATAEAARALDPTLDGRTELNRAFLARRAANLRDAAEALEVASGHFARAGHVKLRALAMNNAGVLQRDLGHLSSAESRLLNALTIRRQIGDAHGTAVTMSNLGAVALDAGRIGDALHWLADGRALLERGNYADELRMVAANEAVAFALAGRLEEANDALQRASDLRNGRPALHALAASVIDAREGNDKRATLRLRRVLRSTSADDALADRFRCARLWRALSPTSGKAAEAVLATARRLGSKVRRQGAEWVTRSSTPPAETESLRALQHAFEEHGRTDLIRAVSTRLSEVLHEGGYVQERRQAEERIQASTEAMVGSLAQDQREASLELIDALSGRRAATTSRVNIDAAWFLGWNRRLAAGEEISELLRSSVSKALEVTCADRGFLVLQGSDDFDLLVAHGMEPGQVSADHALFSRTIVRDVIRTDTPIAAADLLREARFEHVESVAQIGARAVLCVPLPSTGDARGALYVDRESAGPSFDRFDIEALETLADQAAITVALLERQRLAEALNSQLRRQLSYREDELSLMREVIGRSGSTPPVGGLRGESEAIRELHERIGRLAPAAIPVLLSGPRGGQHDAVARALHEYGPRSDGPFVTLNLAAVPPERQADELFGHSREPGDVAGWRQQGLLARAHRGTLFLDAIEELDRGIQTRLLDALETGRHRTEGTSRRRDGDVRLIASCIADLGPRVEEGRLDDELFYYLSAATIRVPSLADRIEDIPEIVRETLEGLARRYGSRKVITEEVVAALTRRPWPGEFRELKNEVSRLYFLAERTLDSPELVRAPGGPVGQVDPMPASYRLEDVERAAVTRALEAAGHTKGRAARLLGISRAGLYKKLQRLGISAAATGSKAPPKSPAGGP